MKYEKLPKICFKCWKIVHGRNGCSSAGHHKKHNSALENQFGSWLRADQSSCRRISSRHSESVQEDTTGNEQFSQSKSQAKDEMLLVGSKSVEENGRKSGENQDDLEAKKDITLRRHHRGWMITQRKIF